MSILCRFHVQTLPLLLDEYIDQGKVKLVFRDFPIQSIHPNALPASVAAECANEQERNSNQCMICYLIIKVNGVIKKR